MIAIRGSLSPAIVVASQVPALRAMLRRLLQHAGYEHVYGASDLSLVASLCERQRPQLLIVDHESTQPDAFAVLEQLRTPGGPLELLPVLVTTSEPDPVLPALAERCGADDVLMRPFTLPELRNRVDHLLHLRASWSAAEELTEQLRRQARAGIAGAELHALVIGSVACASCDGASQGHPERVGRLAGEIAVQLRLPAEFVDTLMAAAPLHDIGKVAVAPALLRKPGPLSTTERSMTRRHALLGARILGVLDTPVMRMATEIAKSHHERWDGEGYPHGMAGEEIPLSARIVAVADVFDALTHDRSYKRAWDVMRAMREITRHAGSQFDPAVVSALLRLASERPTVVLNATAPVGLSSVTERQAQLDTAVAARGQLQRLRFVQDILGSVSVA